MKRINSKSILFLILFFGISINSKAQISALEQKKINELDSLYYEVFDNYSIEKLDSAYQYFLDIKKEYNKPSLKDTAFLEQFYLIYGKLCRMNKKYSISSRNHFEAAIFCALKLKHDSFLYTNLPYWVNSYKVNRENNYILDVPEPTKNELIDIMYPIEYMWNFGNADTIMAKIFYGTMDGIGLGAKGRVVGVKSINVNGHRAEYLGEAEITRIFQNQTEVKIIRVNDDDSAHYVYKKDVVILPTNVPKLKENTISKLLKYNIHYNNQAGYPFYDYRLWNKYGSEEFENIIHKAMAFEINNAYETFFDSELEVLKTVTISGRFKGLTLLEVFKVTKENDVKDFLNYEVDYPYDFIGVNGLLSLYANWVLVNTPYSYGKFLEDVSNSTTDNQLDEISKTYSEGINNESYLYYLSISAEDLTKLDLETEALSLIDKNIKLCKLARNEERLGWAYFSKARIYNYFKNHDKVKESYHTALDIFEKNNFSSGIRSTINNLAANAYNLEQFQYASTLYLKSYILEKQNKTNSDSLDKFLNMAISLHGAGQCFNKLQKYDSANLMFEMAVNFYTKVKTTDSRRRIVDAYIDWSNILKKQGRYLEALPIYEYMIKSNKELGLQKKVADNYDDIGEVYFNLGQYSQANSNYYKARDLKLSWQDYNGAGFSQSNTAQAYYNLGYFDKAIIGHDSAIFYRNLGGDSTENVFSYKQIGHLYSENGDIKNALIYINKALDMYQKNDNEVQYAECLREKGQILKREKNYPEAFKNLELSTIVFKKLDKKQNLALNYYEIGSIFAHNSDMKKALLYYDSANTIQLEIGDVSNRIYTLLNIANILFSVKGKITEAFDKIIQAKTLAKITGKPYDLATSYTRLYYYYSSKSQYQMAKNYLDSALQIYIDIKERNYQSFIYNEFGVYYFTIGKFTEAENAIEKAIQLAQDIKNTERLSLAYKNYANVVEYKSEIKEAEKYLFKSLELGIKDKSNYIISDCYLMLGNLNNNLSNYQEAIKYYKKCDSMNIVTQNDYARTSPLNNIGTIYYFQQNFDSAKIFFTRTLEILEQFYPNEDFYNLVLVNMAETHILNKDYKETLKWLQKAEKQIVQKEYKGNKVLLNRIYAKYYFETKDFTKALEYCKKAYEIQTDSGFVETLVDIFNTFGKIEYELGHYDQALIQFSKCIKKSNETGSIKFAYLAYYYSALAYKKINQNDSAIRNLKKSIELIENISNRVTGGEEAKKMFKSSDLQTKVYETIIQWLIEQGKIEVAISYLERGNIESINAKFKSIQKTEKSDNKTQKSLDEIDEKQKKIEKIESELIKEKAKPEQEQKKELIKTLEQYKQIAQRDYFKFINELVKKDPHLKNFFSNSVNPIDFKDEQENIPPDMAVLLYLIAQKNLYIFCATRDSVFAKVIEIESSKLNKDIATMYNLVRNPSFLPTTRRGGKMKNVPVIPNQEQILNETSQYLYKILIETIKPQILSKKKLAIIPNGDLWYLPFSALINNIEDKKISYLNDEFEILYSNRLKFLGTTSQIDADAIKIIAIGNADNTLPNAEIEVNDIKQIFPSSKVLIGNKATINNVKTESLGCNILHIASHGILDNYEFDSSHLVFAPDPQNNDNGKLTISQIQDFPDIYQYQLVVLSACETNVKSDLSEGWPQTTASAFLRSGVETVFGTLWEVDDKSTSIFIKYFYESLKITKNKREAFHNAQMQISKNPLYSHPYYWAAFSYLGK